MVSQLSYQLIDFGNGEKLEQFGDRLVRRPSLYAQQRKRHTQRWSQADITYDVGSSSWNWVPAEPDESWSVRFGASHFGLKLTPVGHLGVFPEQLANWNWIKTQLPPLVSRAGRPLRALNLFAYTGGTTLALAECGCQTVHVDGAANTVKWARSNAQRSGLEHAPIRWITEDVMRFVSREVSRGNTYDILVADPPSFGRGPKKQQWRIARDFPLLLELIRPLMPEPKAVILSCHTEGFEHPTLSRLLKPVMRFSKGTLSSLKLNLQSEDGRQLESGDCVRWLAD